MTTTDEAATTGFLFRDEDPIGVLLEEACRWATWGALGLGGLAFAFEVLVYTQHQFWHSVRATAGCGLFGAALLLWIWTSGWMDDFLPVPGHMVRHLTSTAAGAALAWGLGPMLIAPPGVTGLTFLMGLLAGSVVPIWKAVGWLDISYAPTLVDRGTALAYLRPRLGLACLNRAIRLDPGYARAFYERAAFLDVRSPTWYDLRRAIIVPERATRNDFEDRAIADFSEAIRLEPRYAEAFLRRGVIYQRRCLHGTCKNHHDDTVAADRARAIADISEAIRINPEDAAAYYERGYTWEDGDERELADYDKAARLEPGSSKYLYSRGCAHLARGDHNRAISDFDEAIRLDSGKFLIVPNGMETTDGVCDSWPQWRIVPPRRDLRCAARRRARTRSSRLTRSGGTILVLRTAGEGVQGQGGFRQGRSRSHHES